MEICFESTEFTELYKYQTYITIAAIINKYGYKDDFDFSKIAEYVNQVNELVVKENTEHQKVEGKQIVADF